MVNLSSPSSFYRCLLVLTIVFSGFVSSCNNASGSISAIDPTKMFEYALLTATYAVQPTTEPETQSTPMITETPTPTGEPTRDPNRTPQPLPATFQTDLLNPLDPGHTYIQDTCEYLKMRWDPGNSVPGTVVMPIMFHSITDGEVTYNDQISVEAFQQIMHDLEQQGFQAITTQQFLDFMEKNTRIPPRSVLLIVDDRKRLAYFETHFKPFYDTLGWKVTNAWISAPDTSEELWQENQLVEAAGYVDHQAHGVIHNIPIVEGTTEDYIRSELSGAMNTIEMKFGKKPVAYIWPGGGFSKRAAEIARELGYRLGFTVNPRGPVMFNWVPLSDTTDPARPSFISEGYINDPLMVLPRYWDTDATFHIDTVRQISKAAASYADQNKAIEMEYYEIMCSAALGPIPTHNP